MFRFKQFSIHDEACAMKVGTDGVLLGAWADLPNRGVCWDVGAGCGLISLMLAQRFEKMHFTAIEIDAPTAVQAKENVENTPFSDRITVLNADHIVVLDGGTVREQGSPQELLKENGEFARIVRLQLSDS